MTGLRRLGAALAVICAGVPALLGSPAATAAPVAAANALRCESCSATSCSSGAGTDTSPRGSVRRGPAVAASKIRDAPKVGAGETGVPGSATAVIYSNFPTQDAGFIARWKKILEGENYKVTEYLAANDGPGTATLANFLSAVKAGVFILSTHGADLQQNGFNGVLVSEYTTQAAVDAAWNVDEKDPAYQGGVLRKVTFVDNHRGKTVYSIWISQKGIQDFFGDSADRPADQLVFNGACWSDHLAASFGSTAYFGYTNPASDPEVYGDVGRLLGRLDGVLNKGEDRDTARAWAAGGFTNTTVNQLVYHAQPPTGSVALSPDVSEVSYPDGQDYSLPGPAGPFKIEFDTAMDTSVSPGSFLSVKGATLTDSAWASPSELTLDLQNSGCGDVCPVTITIASKLAVSAGKFHNWLDGDLDPAGGVTGVYPNGDDEQIPFSFANWHQQTAPNPGPSPDCGGLFAVAVGSPNDVWAVGAQGLGSCVPYGTLAEHWDGKSWSVVTSPTPEGTNGHLFGVTAAGPKSYWAVGLTDNYPADNGSGAALVEHYDGTSWEVSKQYSLGFDASLYDVSAAGPNDIWAVGYGESGLDGGPNQPLIMNYNNGTWTEMTPKIGTGDDTELLGVDAVSPTNIWATGFTVDDEDNSETISALMLHSTGGLFKEVDLGGTTSSTTYTELDSISAVSPNDIWAVGYVHDLDPLIEHYDGKDWSEVPSRLPNSVELESVTAASATSAWAIGESYAAEGSGQVLIHWDGKKWSRVVVPPTTSARVFGLGSSKSGYAVAVGNVNDAPFVEAFTPSAISAPSGGA